MPKEQLDKKHIKVLGVVCNHMVIQTMIALTCKNDQVAEQQLRSHGNWVSAVSHFHPTLQWKTPIVKSIFWWFSIKLQDVPLPCYIWLQEAKFHQGWSMSQTSYLIYLYIGIIFETSDFTSSCPCINKHTEWTNANTRVSGWVVCPQKRGEWIIDDNSASNGHFFQRSM